MNDRDQDRELGMGRDITRRDFLNGIEHRRRRFAAGQANSSWLEAFGVPQSPFAPRKIPAITRPPKLACAAVTTARGKWRTTLRDGSGKPRPESY